MNGMKINKKEEIKDKIQGYGMKSITDCAMGYILKTLQNKKI